MNGIVILHACATLSAPAPVLRPWRMEDVAALVDVFRDPALRRWTSSASGRRTLGCTPSAPT
ncbi:hypothetical protein [Streptomyces doebereineriae]|uniref:Uncharacterized protein n=1 Tax=Streptomyces doebereineriae TaxID=3075528 RepID=A0ABU2VF57_9ACTN|nr:hypothetical protein [Streptomyces sp. DSM 41640]MDT0483973.1 hypothetical protein [Streptomyces sp. DSM 41640]